MLLRRLNELLRRVLSYYLFHPTKRSYKCISDGGLQLLFDQKDNIYQRQFENGSENRDVFSC